MGSPTIIADILSPGPTTQLAARLLDVAPGRRRRPSSPAGSTDRRSTPARRRPARSSSSTRTAGSSRPGHIAKLELLPADQPYGRNSNGQAPITVSNLELRLPVLESPDGGLIQQPAPKVVPAGYELAADHLSSGGGDDDGDGVPNVNDDWPAAPGPSENSGCPVIGADADGDGIPDAQDQCPNQIGPVSNGGCPQPVGTTNPSTAGPTGAGAAAGQKCKKRGKKGKRAQRETEALQEKAEAAPQAAGSPSRRSPPAAR